MSRRLWSSWLELVLGLMPVVAMTALAAWSYWLVRATPGAHESLKASLYSNLPDMMLSTFRADTYDETGRLSSRIQGHQAIHHPSDDSMLVDGAELWSQKESEGQMQEFNAQGQHLWANGGRSQFRLQGKAQILYKSRLAKGEEILMTGQELLIDNDAKTYSSTSPVEIRRGGQILRGDSMLYDQARGVLSMQGKVSVLSLTSPGS